MLQEITSQNDYKSWITEVKSKIRSAQMKAIIAVNSALIHFYWELGKMIAEKVEASKWGDKILEQVSADLKAEFPEMKGLSLTNLKYCKLFFNHFSIRPQAGDELNFINSPQLGDENKDKSDLETIAKIPWGHIKLIINKIKNKKATFFYISKNIENGWSRDTLAL